MINAWSLLYDELNGTMDETYPIKEDKGLKDIELSGGFEWTPGSPWPPYVGAGNTANVEEEIRSASAQADLFGYEPDPIEHSDAWYDYTRNDPDRENPFTDPKDRERAFKVTGNWEENTKWIYESPDGGKTVYRRVPGRDPSTREEVIVDDGKTNKPEPNLEYKSQKYEEDLGIKDLKDYISSTYSGHYTSEQNNTQTLDLIQSVGDAESFCRSNAIKYLARYDKKGQAKRDILKALHYSLLLYHFSGQLNETTTRGYETF